MLIANPIYDAVLNYLLSDLDVAKLVLSVFLEREISDIDLLPSNPNPSYIDIEGNELTPKRKNFHMAFIVNVKLPDGYEYPIFINLQKIRYATTQIQRARYITPIPSYSIYILGFRPSEAYDSSVLLIEPFFRNKHTQEEHPVQGDVGMDFLYEGAIVIVPNLKGLNRDQLEKMLQIFEGSVRESNLHLLEINPDNYPKELHPIIYRLQQAAEDPLLRKQMEAEDELNREING